LVFITGDRKLGEIFASGWQPLFGAAFWAEAIRSAPPNKRLWRARPLSRLFSGPARAISAPGTKAFADFHLAETAAKVSDSLTEAVQQSLKESFQKKFPSFPPLEIESKIL
jgi:hypothetical protein